MIARQSEDTQTLYAELLALLLALEGDRNWSHLAGSFTTKVIRGRAYVYFQYSDPGGRKRQFAVGPQTPALDRIVGDYARGRDRLAADLQQVGRLAHLLRAAGAHVVPHPIARVLRAFADAGVFRLGGVLVGSHAFALLANTLGVAWPEATWRTKDIDVAGHLQLAAPPVDADVPRALDSLSMGFVPVPQLDPRHASTSFKVRGKTLRVDLLTPGSSRQQEPVHIARFNAAAAPVRYLSLLLADAMPTLAVHGTETSLVVVPAPARFCLHKLLVSQTRSPAQHAKSSKDLHQAAVLLEFLAEDRPDDLESVARSFAKSGPAVGTRVQRSLTAVSKRWPPAGEGAALAARFLRA